MRSPTLESKCSGAFETSVGEEAEGGGRGADRRLWLGLGEKDDSSAEEMRPVKQSNGG